MIRASVAAVDPTARADPIRVSPPARGLVPATRGRGRPLRSTPLLRSLRRSEGDRRSILTGRLPTGSDGTASLYGANGGRRDQRRGPSPTLNDFRRFMRVGLGPSSLATWSPASTRTEASPDYHRTADAPRRRCAVARTDRPPGSPIDELNAIERSAAAAAGSSNSQPSPTDRTALGFRSGRKARRRAKIRGTHHLALRVVRI